MFAHGFGSIQRWSHKAEVNDRRALLQKLAVNHIFLLIVDVIISCSLYLRFGRISTLGQILKDFPADILRDIILKISEGIFAIVGEIIVGSIGNGPFFNEFGFFQL